MNADQTQSLAKGLTNTGQIMGTLDYMAPEQTSNTHTVDIRADIYSLGCTLYALLAGRPPFAGSAYSNAYQKMVAHNRESPRPLHEIRSNVPAEVVAVLNKMLAKNPDDRYTSPIEVAAALQPFCANNTLLSTLVEAEARQAEYKAQSDAATQALNSSAMEGTATGAGDDGGYSFSPADELIELLRSTALAETLVAQRPVSTPAIKLDIAAAPTVKQVRQHRAEASNRWRAQIIAAAGCALLGIIITAVVFRIMTNYGTIELALYHKDAQVTVDGDTVRLRPTGDDDHYTIRVAPGKRTLRIEKGGYTTFARELEIAKGEEKIVAITLRRDEPITPPAVPEATSNDSSDSTPPGSSRRSVTATLVAPPPLEEWLVGREILTVKQDGTAMFTKIQDALDALKPGQVVEVLDKGPYRETLNRNMPTDTGLITRASTHVILRDWQTIDANPAHPFTHQGHSLGSGLRLSGFIFSSEPRHEAILMALDGDSVTVEECVFPNIATYETRQRGVSIRAGRIDRPRQIVVRDCVFGGEIYFGLYGGGSRLTVTRNHFRAAVPGLGIGCVQGSGANHEIAIRENVFDRPMVRAIQAGMQDGTFNLAGVIERNTILAYRECMHIGNGIPAGVLRIEYNVSLADRCATLVKGAEQFEDRAAEHVLQRWNGYSRAFPDADGRPLHPSNLIAVPKFISDAPDDRNYARLVIADPFASAESAAGGKTYYGALPPGPAPPEGDWFTRLQERWKVAITLRRDEPITPPAVPEATSNDSSDSTPQGSSRRSVTATLEPPPLEEWLKDREILTVKQDGSAMFTKIQDALDKAKPGQVVEILDRGPYRERLTLDGIGDGGLISHVQTVIEPADYEETELTGEPLLTAHRGVDDCEGMRIANIDFVFDQEVATRGLIVEQGCVIDHCVFRCLVPGDATHAPFFAHQNKDRPWKSPLIVQNCVFAGGMLYLTNHWDQPESAVRVRRTLFIGEGGQKGKGIAVTRGFGSFVCRDCIFAGKTQTAIAIVNHDPNLYETDYRLVNNTLFAGRQGAVAAYLNPVSGVRFENNVFVGKAFLSGAGVTEEAFFENWSVRHNWFTDISQLRDQAFVQQDPSNRSGPLNFLSTDQNHRDFLRLPATFPAAIGGAGGDQPTYLGALPPGPAPPDGDWFTRLQERWKLVQEK